MRASARHEALRRIAIAALGSVTLGLLVGLGLQGLHMEEARPVAPAPMAAAPAGAPATEPAPATPPPPSDKDARRNPNPDAATLDRYQAELARALAGKPGIASGVWLTRQTLAINRTGELDAVWPRVCEEVLHYPALRNVRIQLNARPGVDEPVRWRQCATY